MHSILIIKSFTMYVSNFKSLDFFLIGLSNREHCASLKLGVYVEVEHTLCNFLSIIRRANKKLLTHLLHDTYIQRQILCILNLISTSGFATTHVVVPGHCNEKFCFKNILYFRCKWAAKSSTARVHHYFPANASTNPDVF